MGKMIVMNILVDMMAELNFQMDMTVEWDFQMDMAVEWDFQMDMAVEWDFQMSVMNVMALVLYYGCFLDHQKILSQCHGCCSFSSDIDWLLNW